MHAQISNPNGLAEAEPQKARDLPAVFRLSKAKDVLDVTDETLLKWEAQSDGAIRIHRYGGVVLVETQSVLDYLRSQPARARTNRGRKTA